MYGKSPSTISSVVAKKEVIREANITRGVNMVSKKMIAKQLKKWNRY